MKNHVFLTSVGTVLIILTTCLSVAEPATNRYVVKDNSHAEAPYDTWDNAAPDIQTAINAAISANNDKVVVAPGVYDSGTTWDGKNNTRVYLTKKITVISRDNDPATTILQGSWDPVSTNGPQAVRCVYMLGGGQLIGFTLTNGATASITNSDDRGGGYIGDGTVSNCIITGCSAYQGGGVSSGTLYNCLVENNFAHQGGGTYFTTLHNCIVRRNQAKYGGGNQSGGGVIQGASYNCLIEDNQSSWGGGARNATLYNCTIINNTGYSWASGTHECTFYNSISWNNVDYLIKKAYYSRGDGDAYLDNNCTQADPLFVDAENGNWRLRSNSPCVNTGTNLTWMASARDLDGRSRLYGEPDMGCYEYYPQGTVLLIK